MSTTTSSLAPAGIGRSNIKQAFERFSNTVSKSDAHKFENTTLEDVYEAAKEVERQLGDKGEQRSLRRLHPFLTALKQYSAPIEVLCNGTPYLPWIWAPVKLFLQISSEYLTAFDTLIKAYGEIADALPRFDLLSQAFRDQPHFQDLLSIFYCDILEFHRRAYKFLRARGWKRFFDSSWGRFDLRFKGVLGDLRYHAQLVENGANAAHIASAEEWRRMHFDTVNKQDQDRASQQLQAVLHWLDTKDHLQQDYVDNLLDRRCTNTNAWFLDHVKIEEWIKGGNRQSALWLNGIPGSGKSVLAAQLVRHLETDGKSVVLYFFCNFRTSDLNTCSYILRSIITQVAQKHESAVALLYNDFVVQGKSPAKANLKTLLRLLLDSIPSIRMVFDGLDECSAQEQKQLVDILRQITRSSTDSKHGIAIFSRKIPPISQNMGNAVEISLEAEAAFVRESIEAYVHHEVEILRDHVDTDVISTDVFAKIKDRIVAKADGMFLWVRLVLDTLKDLHSTYDLENAVDDLPRGLHEAYERILQRITEDAPRGSYRRATVILSLVSAAQRSLKAYEVLDGVAFCVGPHEVNAATKRSMLELDRCRPLIDVDSFGKVSFVHFTVKEYIFDESSGPFLRSRSADNDIALACLYYLASSLKLVNPHITRQQRMEDIAKGFHGLHRYAMAFWLPHLVQVYNNSDVQAEEKDDEVHRYFTSFCRQYEDISRMIRLERPIPPADGDAASKLWICEDYPELQVVFATSSSSRHHRHQVDDAAGLVKTGDDSNSQSPANTTLLMQVALYYDRSVQELLSDEIFSEYPELDPCDVRRFRKTYEKDTFVCRQYGCGRRSQGFATEEARDTHEREHEPRFFCEVTSCFFAESRGFRTPALLQTHMRKYHSSASATLPPFRATKSKTSNTSDKRLMSDIPPELREQMMQNTKMRPPSLRHLPRNFVDSSSSSRY